MSHRLATIHRLLTNGRHGRQTHRTIDALYSVAVARQKLNIFTVFAVNENTESDIYDLTFYYNSVLIG